MTCSLSYIGRFAPSPSGPLHFGSLVTAVGSYLQAKSNDGKWLLRIEDIDPPREVVGASDAIFRCLDAHALHWDGQPSYQSQHSERYEARIQQLVEADLAYVCQCTRASLTKLGSGDCPCLKNKMSLAEGAIRFRHNQPIQTFEDRLLRRVTIPPEELTTQFAIRRRDGLFAYQLAVVTDDIEQGITEVARGADLLSATVFQLALYQAFKHTPPSFLHFPLVMNTSGLKLSKQNHAPAIVLSQASNNLTHALRFLGLSVPDNLLGALPEVILEWAVVNWNLDDVVAKTEQIDNRIEGPDRI